MAILEWNLVASYWLVSRPLEMPQFLTKLKQITPSSFLLEHIIVIFNQWKKVIAQLYCITNRYLHRCPQIILGTAFEIEYQVLEGGDLDIDFQMSSPSGTLLFNELRSEEGLHEIASAEEGDYKVGYFQ